MFVNRTPTFRNARCIAVLSLSKIWHVSKMWTGVSGTLQISQLGSSARWNLKRLSLSLEWPIRSLAIAVSVLLFVEEVHGQYWSLLLIVPICLLVSPRRKVKLQNGCNRLKVQAKFSSGSSMLVEWI